LLHTCLHQFKHVLFIVVAATVEDRVFERILFPIVKHAVCENKEEKASQGGTIENEREYSILEKVHELCGQVNS